MGFAKKAFLALLSLSIIFAVYLAKIEFDRYDVDQYHDKIVAQLGDELGIGFQFESYSLSIIPSIEYTAITPVIEYQGTTLRADEVSVHLSISSILLGRPIISEIMVKAPEIVITRDKEGKWDIEPLLMSAGGGGGGGSSIKRVSITGGGIDIVDESVPGEPKMSRFEISTARFYSPGIQIPARMNLAGTVVDEGRRTPASLSVKWKTGREETGLTGIQLEGRAKVLSLSSEYFHPYLADAPPEWFTEKYVSASVNFSGDLMQDFDFSGGVSMSSAPVAEESVAEEVIGRSSKRLEFRGLLKSDRFVLNKFQLHWPLVNVTGYLEVDDLKGGNPHVKAMLDSSSIDITNLNRLIESKIFPRVWENLFLQNIYSGSFRFRDIEYDGRIKDLLDGAGGKRIGNFNGKLEIENLSLQMQNMNKPIDDINGVATIDSEKITFNNISARYGLSTIRNISGSVDEYITNPILHSFVEADLDLGEFQNEVMRNIRSKELRNVLRKIKNLNGSIDFFLETKFDLTSVKPPEFAGDLQFRNISLNHSEYKFPVNNLNGTVLIDRNMIKIDDLSWYVGSSIWRADGGVVGYLDENYLFEFTVDAAGDASEYSKTLQRISPSLKGIKGTFGSKVEVTGTLDEMEFVNRLDLTDMEFGYGDMLSKPNGLLSQVFLSGKIKSQKELLVKKIDIKLGKSSLSASGEMKNISSFSDFKISLKASKIRLDEMHLFSPDINKGAIKGVMSGDFYYKRKRGISNHNYRFDLELKNADLGYFKNFEPVKGLSLEGRVAGRIKGKIKTGKPFQLTGTIKAKEIGLDAKLAQPIRGMSGDIEFLGERMRIFDVPVSMGDSSGNLSLYTKMVMNPVINLHIDGKEIFLRDIVGKEGEKEKTSEKVKPDMEGDFNPKWEIAIKSEKGTLGSLKYRELDSLIKYSDDRFEFDHLNFNEYKGKFEISGTLNTKYNQEIFDVAIKMDKVNIKLLLADLYPESDEISGSLNLKANLTGNSLEWERLSYSLGGDVKFTISDGLIQQFDGVSQVFSYINILPLFISRTEEQKGRGVPFDTFAGNFTLTKGVAKTENTSIEGDILRVSMVGEINFAEEKLDLLLGLKPFTTIDKVVSNIPIAGNILTGKGKSLIVSYYRVGGEFKEITSEAVPAESVARTAIGIVQRLLETPARALSVDDPESDKK